ncbi:MULTISPECIES: RagB/SusD family nutrient uptake outer membrane protein [unclassified Saccharicrinis]|uniref:RagB/SusD family nutrient uptake outer membrane protein n=1 Tax=unclassified Saccharicrinis TaxID=2646859 RepID=UPI003D330F74
MNKIYKYSLMFFLLLGVLTSCEDELLDQANPNAITTGSFWQSADDFDKAVNAMYSALQFPAVSGGEVTKAMLIGDMAGTESWYGSALTFTNLTWNDATAYVVDRWSQLYVGILRANQVLHYVEGASFFTEEEKTSIKAQARFLRGYNYFLLAVTYNQAIIQDKLAFSSDDFHKPMSTREEVINAMVIPDLTYAYEHLPKTWDGNQNIGRFTWGAAASMLGKTYLYEKDFTNAAKYFKEVIDEADDNGLYRLVTTYMDNFTLEGEFNSESILEVAFSDNYKAGASGARQDDIGSVPGSEAQNYPSAFASIVGAGGYNTVLPTYWLQELFVAGDSIDVGKTINAGMRYSQRTYASIVVEYGDGEYYNAPLTATDDEKSKANFNYGQGSKVKKWTNWYWKDTEDASTGARCGINIRLIRLADVYLMYAESVLERDGESGVAEALTYIEKVRERAGVLTLQQYMDEKGGMMPKLDKPRFPHGLAEHELVNLNAANLMTHLRMVERPLELAFEGYRWYDLVRWGIAADVFSQRLTEQGLISDKLIGNYINKDDGSADEKIFPLYLNERVRPDWTVPTATYNSATHDYFPVPSIEAQRNKLLQE